MMVEAARPAVPAGAALRAASGLANEPRHALLGRRAACGCRRRTTGARVSFLGSRSTKALMAFVVGLAVVADEAGEVEVVEDAGEVGAGRRQRRAADLGRWRGACRTREAAAVRPAASASADGALGVGHRSLALPSRTPSWPGAVVLGAVLPLAGFLGTSVGRLRRLRLGAVSVAAWLRRAGPVQGPVPRVLLHSLRFSRAGWRSPVRALPPRWREDQVM